MPEFRDVRLDDDHMWRGRHIGSSQEACGADWEQFLRNAAAIRITESFRRASR